MSSRPARIVLRLCLKQTRQSMAFTNQYGEFGLSVKRNYASSILFFSETGAANVALAEPELATYNLSASFAPPSLAFF